MGFHSALTWVLEKEGGATVTMDPADPGGLTKYGISQRAYPALDIRALTLQDAQNIYKKDYWDRVSGDEFHDAVALCVFDCAVNQGVPRAIKLLQKAVGLPQDGIIGPQTIAAVKGADPKALVERFQAERILHYASLGTWERFGRGWARRAIGTTIRAFNG